MIRSAAKNHRWVLVVTSPERYEKVLGDLQRARAARAAASTGSSRPSARSRTRPSTTRSSPTTSPAPARIDSARHGAEPAQGAGPALRREPAPAARRCSSASSRTRRRVAFAKQLHGKELSYINLLDADAALNAVKELDAPAACIVKHATPCGFATADDLPTAFTQRVRGRPARRVRRDRGAEQARRPGDGRDDHRRSTSCSR